MGSRSRSVEDVRHDYAFLWLQAQAHPFPEQGHQSLQFGLKDVGQLLWRLDVVVVAIAGAGHCLQQILVVVVSQPHGTGADAFRGTAVDSGGDGIRFGFAHVRQTVREEQNAVQASREQVLTNLKTALLPAAVQVGGVARMDATDHVHQPALVHGGRVRHWGFHHVVKNSDAHPVGGLELLDGEDGRLAGEIDLLVRCHRIRSDPAPDPG